MKSIGGFFELELPKGGALYHDKALALTTGRACQRLALQKMNVNKVYLPYYCCDALFEPCELDGIKYEFYKINEKLELREYLELKEGECLIYTNYFGIKQSYVFELIEVYKEKLLIDDTHSFFNLGYELNYSFTSARKYFGVPDGAFLYFPNNIIVQSEFPRNIKISVDHNVNRFIGNQKTAYDQYQKYEESLGSDLELISLLSERLLMSIDYNSVKAKRIENFEYLFSALSEINQLEVALEVDSPFCYPLLLEKPFDKSKLYTHKVFIPSLWLDTEMRVNRNDFSLECSLSVNLLPIPIDHRYDLDDMKKIVNLIFEIYK